MARTDCATNGGDDAGNVGTANAGESPRAADGPGPDCGRPQDAPYLGRTCSLAEHEKQLDRVNKRLDEIKGSPYD
jgi:hypothetical protein